jgi:hypothetical protein
MNLSIRSLKAADFVAHAAHRRGHPLLARPQRLVGRVFTRGFPPRSLTKLFCISTAAFASVAKSANLNLSIGATSCAASLFLRGRAPNAAAAYIADLVAGHIETCDYH